VAKPKLIDSKLNSAKLKSLKFNSPRLNNLKLMKSNTPGSLMIFNLAIFLILFSLTFICMNLVSVYAAKRELIATTEAALSSSSKHLDSLSYYLGLNRFQNNKKVPINCDIARVDFYRKIQSSTVKGKAISINYFRCDGYFLETQVEISAAMPIAIPLISAVRSKTSGQSKNSTNRENISQNQNSVLSNEMTIRATVGVTSPYR
jgi:hypothetical protein